MSYIQVMFSRFGAALLASSALAACGWQEVERAPDGEPPTRYDEVDGFLELPADLELGQVTGLAVDSRDRLLVFHRAGRDFDNEELIDEPTILVFDAASGQLLDRFGEGLFVVPHGLSVDPEDHVWATDARRHLVVELSPEGEVLSSFGGDER